MMAFYISVVMLFLYLTQLRALELWFECRYATESNTLEKIILLPFAYLHNGVYKSMLMPINVFNMLKEFLLGGSNNLILGSLLSVLCFVVSLLMVPVTSSIVFCYTGILDTIDLWKGDHRYRGYGEGDYLGSRLYSPANNTMAVDRSNIFGSNMHGDQSVRSLPFTSFTASS